MIACPPVRFVTSEIRLAEKVLVLPSLSNTKGTKDASSKPKAMKLGSIVSADEGADDGNETRTVLAALVATLVAVLLLLAVAKRGMLSPDAAETTARSTRTVFIIILMCLLPTSFGCASPRGRRSEYSTYTAIYSSHDTGINIVN
jgi:hypothetical protein